MRKRLHEEPDNKERWLVSYADFITLLFAFFVVMYSISSVNEGKYKVLSESLHGVFNVKQRSVNPIQVGEEIPFVEEQNRGEPIIQPLIGFDSADEIDPSSDQNQGGGLESIASQFEREFEDLIRQDNLDVKNKGNWLEVSVSNTILFDSGGVQPLDSALRVIERIADVLNANQNAVLVEGHTDNLPIRSTIFPTNWELSAARAASVVRYLTVEGIGSDRMGAIGYGEHKPVARNDTAEGRRKNRRVVLLISKSDDLRESILN